MIHSNNSGDKPCCMDTESGLYHFWHFKSVLAQELARLDRWERPLCLALIEAPALSGESWAVLGNILRSSLRRIDLAARLSEAQAAVIMPDADEHRAKRWLFECTLEMEKALGGQALMYGLALARPWEGRTVDDLMRLAAANLGADPLESLEDEGACVAFSGTAIVPEERNLLFAGFQELGTH